MKKFLTVLLALSVVFTYTFGTAFATGTDPVASEQRSLEQVKLEIADNATALQAANEGVATRVLDTLFPNTDVELKVFADTDSSVGDTTKTKVQITLTKAAVKAYLAEKVKEANDKIDVQRGTLTQTAINAANTLGFVAFNNNSSDAADPAKYPKYVATMTTSAGEALAFNTFVGTKEITTACAADSDAYFKLIDTTFAKTTTSVSGTLPTGITANDYVLSNATAKDVVSAQYVNDRDAQIEAIKKIDTAVYSTVVPSGEVKSNNQKAIEAKSDALSVIGKMPVTSSTTVGRVAQYITNINAIYAAPVGLGHATGLMYDSTTGKLRCELVYTLDQTTAALTATGSKTLSATGGEAVAAKKLAYAKEIVLADLTKKINAARQDFVELKQQEIIQQQVSLKPDTAKIAKAENAIAKAKEDYAKVLEVATYLVNQVENHENLVNTDTLKINQTNWAYTDNTADGGVDDTMLFGVTGNQTVALQVARADKVAELKKDAELYKQAILIDGSMLYDIDADLKAKIDDAYTATTTTDIAKISLAKVNLADALDAYKAKLVGEDPATATIKTISYPTVGTWFATGFTGYDEAKRDELRAVKTLAEDSIDAAKTFDEADAAFLAAYAKFKVIPTTAQHDASFAPLGNLNVKYTKYVSEFEAYVAGKVASLASLTTTSDYTASWNTAVIGYYVNNTTPKNGMFQNGVYTEADLDKVFAEAKAFVDTLKTKKQLADQRKAIMAKMAAVPATVTLADKATVTAIAAEITAYNDYCAVIANTDTIPAFGQEASIQKLDADKIVVAYNAIMKDGKVTLDEKAAVLELKKAFEAYAKEYQAKNAATDLEDVVGTMESTTATKINGAVKAIDTLEAKDVDILIAKLPMYVTSADVKAIKAAKTAYDALTTQGRSLVNTDMKTKLTAALKVLEQYEVAAVTGLKITASSVAKKGKITVKWRVQPKNVKVDGYQVYKSAKKFSAYKKAFTTTKLTYKNTKQLKKGTTYYYKVRAYKVLDGKKVYSDWSNKAVRVAK